MVSYLVFQNETEPVRRAIYLQKVAPFGKKDHFVSIEEGVRRLRDGLFAFHMETGPGYKLIGRFYGHNFPNFLIYKMCCVYFFLYSEVIDNFIEERLKIQIFVLPLIYYILHHSLIEIYCSPRICFIPGEIFDEGEKCGLKEIQFIQVIDPWLAVQKHSPYKEFLKIG